MQSQAGNSTVMIIIITLLLLSLCAFIIGILFFYQKKQISYQNDISALKIDFERTLLNTQLEIQEQTFQNISREIHDNISLSLTMAKLKMNTLNFYDKTIVTEQLNSSIDYISKAINDLSDISRSLNSEVISEQGLIKALDIEIGKIKKLELCAVHLQLSGTPLYMDGQKELVIFRIVQEALNNILKHANASFVRLDLNYGENYLFLTIEDNGIGFDNLNATSGTAGLRNMKRRAEIIHGELEVKSILSTGTKIKLKIPF